jgi:hypothetical protein
MCPAVPAERGNMGYGNNGGQRFEPKPGTGTLFVKGQKRGNQSPDYDGYFIADRVIQPGEKIKLVGWDKQSGQGNMITLKVGREPQNAPGFNGGFGQRQPYNNPNGNYNGGQNNGYGQASQPQWQQPQAQAPWPNPGHRAPAPQAGYQNPNPTYSSAAPLPQAPAGQYVPPGPNGSGAPPTNTEDLPF